MLETIEIKNFRSCTDVHVRLGEAVIALLGKNGAGKTNVIHAIQLAADLCVGDVESAFSLHPRDLHSPTYIALKFSIETDHYLFWTKRSAIPSKNDIFEESLSKNGLPLFERSGEVARVQFADFPSEIRFGTSVATLAALLQILPKEHPAVADLKPVSAYLRAVRYYSLLQGFQEHFVGPQRGFIGDALGDSSAFIEVPRYESWKAEMAQGRARRSVQMRLLHMYLTDSSSFHELKTLLGDDGLGLLSDIQVEQVRMRNRQPSSRAEEASEAAYAFTFVPGRGLAGAGRPFRFSGLSAGTWRILQLMTYLIFDKTSCMLLEQPEDSVHPGLLAKVIDILRTYSGRTQLICTTHSPRVMNLVGASGIRLVTAAAGNTHVDELTADSLQAARVYMQDEGTLADFLDTL